MTFADALAIVTSLVLTPIRMESRVNPAHRSHAIMKTEKNVALRIYSLGKLVNKLMDTALARVPFSNSNVSRWKITGATRKHNWRIG